MRCAKPANPARNRIRTASKINRSRDRTNPVLPRRAIAPTPLGSRTPQRNKARTDSPDNPARKANPLNQAKADNLHKADRRVKKVNQYKVNQAKVNQAKVNQAKVNQAKVNQVKVNQVKVNQVKVNQAKVDSPDKAGNRVNLVNQDRVDKLAKADSPDKAARNRDRAGKVLKAQARERCLHR